jgi:hypothetical protein
LRTHYPRMRKLFQSEGKSILRLRLLRYLPYSVYCYCARMVWIVRHHRKY